MESVFILVLILAAIAYAALLLVVVQHQARLNGQSLRFQDVETDVDQLKAEMAKLDVVSLQGPDLEELASRVAGQAGELDRLDASHQETVRRLDLHDLASGGGFWRTQDGHVLRMRDLSTTHILNIVDGEFGSEAVRDLVKTELRRRQREEALDRVTRRTLGLNKEERHNLARKLAQITTAEGNKIQVDETSIEDYVRRLLRGDET